MLRIDLQSTTPLTRRQIVLPTRGVKPAEVVTRFSVMKVLEPQRRDKCIVCFIPTSGARQHHAEIIVGSRVRTFALLDRATIRSNRGVRFTETCKCVAEIIETSRIKIAGG